VPGNGPASYRNAKVVTVVDKDIDVMDRTQIMFALGSRWQPAPATETIGDVQGIVTDPSQPVQGRTSKIIIDATMQWPEEGGEKNSPPPTAPCSRRTNPTYSRKLTGSTLALWGRRLEAGG